MPARADLREVAQAVQHAFREERDVALLMAGLPGAAQDVLSDEVITFLRRAEHFSLGRVSDEDARRALREPILVAGRTIDDEALEVAIDGAAGYPFLLQLVGARIWSAEPSREQITVDDARAGVERAVRRMSRMVHEPALADLSPTDRAFLTAMSDDSGPSRVGDIGRRLGVSTSYVGQYRRRLIAADVISSVGHGLVNFTIPYLRDYLRDRRDRE